MTAPSPSPLQRFLDESSRRRVGRVAVGYAVLACILIQVANPRRTPARLGL
jgi:uncharacterized membrane protein